MSKRSTPLAWLNGRLIPASAAAIPVTDAGFVMGTTASEQLRTFGGRLFRLAEHLARLRRSLEIVGVEVPLAWTELADVATDLAARNHALLEAGDDLGLAILVTPGPYRTFCEGASAGGSSGPTVCLHTYPLPFSLWARKYESGDTLVTTSIEQVPAACWPAELKVRSRLHYHLAERQAAARQPGARALLLNQQGHVTETATANVLVYRRLEGLISPPKENILPGISLAFARELAAEASIPFLERDLTSADVAAADEVLLTSTPFAVLPVSAFNGRPIGDTRPGELFGRLLSAWSQAVGVAIAEQAVRFAAR